MTSTTRIPHAPLTGIVGAMVKKFSKRRFGAVPDPIGVMWHNRTVLQTLVGLSGKAKKWNACSLDLKSFAHMAVASMVGCGFCLDFGYYQAHNEKLDMDKAREVPRWRESKLFSPLERDVLEYAEAMTSTPPTVTDELSARLLEALGAPALVELTSFIGLSNMGARNNTALGIESQGFAKSCNLRPLAAPRRAAATAA